jgi:Ca2+-binding RTX toxin-like protein
MNKLLLAVLLSALSIGCTSECPNVWTEGGTTVGNNANNDLRAPFSQHVQDTIYALDGRNFIDGRAGDDELYGGSGHDNIKGSDDEDYIVGGRGRDYLFGGPHADVIEAADGWKDEVNCGSGDKDKASVDKVDSVSRCEFVSRGG